MLLRIIPGRVVTTTKTINRLPSLGGGGGRTKILQQASTFCHLAPCSKHLCLRERRTSIVADRSFRTSSLAFAKDYYKILGVDRNASAKDIKKAYYELAKKYHPDTNKGDSSSAKKFQEVSEAYQVLSDDSKRKEYDQFGTNFSGGAAGGGGGGSPFGKGFSGFEGFSSSFSQEDLFRRVFDEMRMNFGGGAGGGGFNGAEDYTSPIQVELTLAFNEAAKGVKKEVHIDVIDTCPKCHGSK